jgi:glycosyltransferase involved in cell wall biosynthesis
MSLNHQPFLEHLRHQQPLVSCIVPVYNKSAYLKETIDSLLTQSYSKLEILIIDDGSTDSSVAVANKIAADNPGRGIRVLSKRNGGISDTRNFGLREAQGRVVLCIDGDDLVLPSFIERAVELMRREGANLVCSDVELFGTESGEWIPEPYDPFYVRYNNCIPTLAIFDRDLWLKTGGYKPAIPFAEDWEFFINCSRYDLVVRKIPEKLFRYRRTEGGLLTSYLKDKWEEPVALVMLANSDLYNIKDLEFAQSAIVRGGQGWFERFQKQDLLHPNEWLIKFILGIFEESRGNRQRALELYAASAQSSQLKNWLPLLRIGYLVEEHNPKQAYELYHQVRILRADMHFVIGAKADLLQSGGRAGPRS